MENGTPILDDDDRRLLIELQKDATRSLERIARAVGLAKTTVWNRMQRLTQSGVIIRQAAILDPKKVGLKETFFVSIRTSDHARGWLEKFYAAIQEIPQITEAHRLAGSLDYLLKVQVSSTAEFDRFYKELVTKISIHDVSSSLSMEVIKSSLELPIAPEALE